MRIRKDLDTALAFVTKRIEEEAMQSGSPLSDDERVLLHDLPRRSEMPMWSDSESLVFVPRDTAYEKLCTAAKAAYRKDLLINPNSASNWEFAAAVSRLNRHPISWLLHWAKVKERKPWWDKWALLAAALLFIASMAVPMVLAGAEPWTPLRWTAVGIGYVAAIVLMYFASRRIEEWQLKRTIERCRSRSGSIGLA